MEQKRYRIMIETSSLCNARCEFCSNPTLVREKKVMDDAMFSLIIERILKEKIDVEKFILHLNGEPFTDKKLIDRIKLLKQTFPEVPIWFTTNFSMPDKNKIEELLISGLHTITISLNAVDGERYHKITGLNFERTTANIDYLVKRNRELGNPIHIRMSIVDCGPESHVEEFKERYSDMAEIRVIKLGAWIGKESKKQKDNSRNRMHLCDDLMHQICILSNGDYAICCFDCEGQVHKNITDIPILQAFYSEPYEDLRGKLKQGVQGTMCENCSFV